MLNFPYDKFDYKDLVNSIKKIISKQFMSSIRRCLSCLFKIYNFVTYHKIEYISK